MKIIVLTCVHGRIDTVKYAVSRSPKVERLIVYSNDKDVFELDNSTWIKHENNPISMKWQRGVEELRNIDFDYAMMMGSDDWFCDGVIPLIEKHKGFDKIAFNDIYFEDIENAKAYYWGGYEKKKKTAGAGRCYSKSFLEKIDYKLWETEINKGLDAASSKRIMDFKPKKKVLNCKKNKVIICDVKDGMGLTSLNKFTNLELL